MLTIYWLAAVIGGTLLVIQVIMTFFGGDADVDVEADVDVDAADMDVEHGVGFASISLRTIVAFMTFFGLAGLAADYAAWKTLPSLGVAVGAGLVAFYLVGWLMLQLHRLKSSGNIQIRNAIGQPGKIYLGVPAGMSGAGKVSVTVQNRVIQYRAMTRGDAMATSEPCRIVAIHGNDIVLVEPVVKKEEAHA